MTATTGKRLAGHGRFWLVAGALLAMSGCASRTASDAAAHPEYGTPQTLMATLRSDPNTLFSEEEGWVRAADPVKRQVWIFTPRSHPAHPAALKRELFEQSGEIMVRTGVLCAAAPADCNSMLSEVERADEVLRGMLP